MPQIDILIQGRSYSLQCAEGEEKRAHSLAAHINRHAGRLTARLGAMPDAQLLLMVSMMIADELLEARENIGRLQEEGGEVRPLLTSAEEEAERATRTGASRTGASRTGASRTGSFLAEEDVGATRTASILAEEDVADSDTSQAIAEAVATEAAADVEQDDPTELSASRTGATRTASILAEEDVADSDTSQAIAEAVATEEADVIEEEIEEESTAEQAEHDRELAERIEASSRRLERIADLLEAEQSGTLQEALAEDPEGGADGEEESGQLDFSPEEAEAEDESDAEPEPSPPPRRGFRPD